MRPIRHHYAIRPVDTPEISLRGIGIHEAMRPGSVNRPRGIDSFLFVFFHEEVTDTVGVRTVRYPAGTLMIWRPHVPHNFGNRQAAWDHTWMLVTGRLIVSELRRRRIPCRVPISAPVSAVLEKTLFEIDQEAMLQVPADAEYVGNLLRNLFIDIGRSLHRRPRTSAVPREYLHVKAYLDNHFAEPITLAQLAKLVHRSVPRFATRFKAIFGLPPLEYLIRLRMQRAQFLLHDQGLNIAEISRDVGYDDPHYFSRLFRMRFGLSPKQARENR